MSWTKTGIGTETIGDGTPSGPGQNGPLPVSFAGAAAAALADAAANPTLLSVGALPSLYNGTTWDLQRNNQQGTLLASAARTAAAGSAIQTNYNARGVAIFLNISAASGTGGLTLTFQPVDPVTGFGINLVTGVFTAPIVTTGMALLLLYPGLASFAAARQVYFGAAVPRAWGVAVNVGDASSYTYSLGYSYIV